MNREDHRLYSTWKSMKTRCNNPNANSYPRYGGRGIKVCERWSSCFWNFVEDMDPSHEEGRTLDRIDNDKGYYPENCRWSTHEEQANNQNRKYTKIYFEGNYYTESELSRVTSISRTTLQARRNKGWTDHEIVFGRCNKEYQIGDLKYNLKELAALLKTSPQNLHQHFKRGKTLEEILNEFDGI